MRKWNRSLFAVLFVLCLAVSAQASLFFGPSIDVVDQAYVKEKVGQCGRQDSGVGDVQELAHHEGAGPHDREQSRRYLDREA